MDKIEEFLREFPEKNTRKTYKNHLNNFFNFVKVPNETYFDNNRDYLRDFKDFSLSLTEYAPLTRLGRLNCIMLFMEENDYILPRREWKKIKKRIKGNRAITLDRTPTRQELKRILQHGDSFMQSLALLGTSTGMRIGEMLELLPEDIDINSNPIRIEVRDTKTGIPRITYASQEFKEAYIEWMRDRPAYLKRATMRQEGVGAKKKGDPRVYPLIHASVSRKWCRMLKKAKLDDRDTRTKYYKLHIHTWRKFYETRMSDAGVPEAIYQQLEGHEGYLNGAYKRYTETELTKWYKKGLENLLIYKAEVTPEQVDDLGKQLQKKDTEIEELKQEMRTIKAGAITKETLQNPEMRELIIEMLGSTIKEMQENDQI